MRLALALSAILVGGVVSTANAQTRSCPISDYSPGFDGCLHRHVDAVLKGCRERRNECNVPPPPQAAAPKILTVASPDAVARQFSCDIAVAAQASKGKAVDFSKAKTIKGQFAFSTVTTNTAEASASVGIPVFSATVTPSLALNNITSISSKTTETLSVDITKTCSDPSSPNWVLADIFTSFALDSFTKSFSFILTKKAGAGLKLNIVVVSFGPQLQHEVERTQQVCLVVDWTKGDAKPSCSGSSE